jgi:hypothetical protein
VATTKNDWLTVAALGLLAMCIVTADHEALGHGGACLALGGHIRILTSSIFHCSLRSGWIDPAGPAMNLLGGILALIARAFVPRHRVKTRLFLILVTAFAFFWEGGYLIHAMHRQDGDLYFFLNFMAGPVTVEQRGIAAAIGLAFYILTWRLTSSALLTVTADVGAARAVARTAWLAATLGAAIAAACAAGLGWQDLQEAVMEIGLASFPLLIIPLRGRPVPDAVPALARSYPVVILSVVVFAAFVATLGRGMTA